MKHVYRSGMTIEAPNNCLKLPNELVVNAKYPHLRDDVISWLDDTIGKTWLFDEMPVMTTFADGSICKNFTTERLMMFNNEADLILFKLRWL